MSANDGKFISRGVDLRSTVVVLSGSAQAQLAVTAAASQTAAFADGGLYDVWCDEADCWLAVGAAPAATVSTTTGYKLYKGNVVSVFIGGADKLGAVSSTAGTLRYHKVNQGD